MSPTNNKDPNSNKVMDILEKMRVVKKVEDDTPEEMSEADNTRVRTALLETEAETETAAYTEAMPQPAPAPQPAPPPAPAYSAEPQSPSGIPTEDRSLFWDDSPAEGAEIDRYLDVERLYAHFSMKSSGVDTIYLIESYIKTLPDTLPPELRRSIILKIISASGFDFDYLLNDGIDRVSRLSDYAASFATRTEEIVERHNVEIDALERQIQQIREMISERKNLHKRQFLTIESEAQRLKDVLDFITK